LFSFFLLTVFFLIRISYCADDEEAEVVDVGELLLVGASLLKDGAYWNEGVDEEEEEADDIVGVFLGVEVVGLPFFISG